MAAEEAWRLARRRRFLTQLDEQNQMLTEILLDMTASNQKVASISTTVGSIRTDVRDGFTSLEEELDRQAESQAEIIKKLNRIIELKGLK